MHAHRRRSVALSVVLFAAVARLPAAAQQPIPSPEEFFGHVMGADRQLARWDRLVEYYRLLGERSDRILVVTMGPSTLGHPFLVLYVSSPENLARLDEYQRLNAILTDPRGHTEAEVEHAIANGKAVVVQSYGLHSTEVAASQTAAEVAYDMVTRTDEEMRSILTQTIAILIPAFNPDGNVIVTDWYNRWVGTDYEGVGPPELYHHYIGHDNNRDAFMQNTIESYYGAEILFRAWVPQAYIDHHQMGPYGARIYVPPYAEPIRPHGDPLVWREMAWYGAHIAYKSEEAGRQGVVNSAVYSGWGHFGFHWITPFHNIAGMLTESASARLATPLYVHPDQLRGSRQLPEYEAQTTFPNPWMGGWWTVRDMVINQKIATFAALDIAARNRNTVLRTMYLKAVRQTERGAAGRTAAFIVPAEQHDPLTAATLVNKLLGQGIEVRRADAGFTHEGRVYGAGSYVVSMAQPKRGVIRWLLGRTFYPDNTYTRNADGDPIRPYDMSTDNIAEYMGVRVDPVGAPVTNGLTVVADTVDPTGAVARGAIGYVVDGRLNAAFRAVNMLWEAGVRVRRADRAASAVRPGDWIVAGSARADVLARIAEATGVDFAPLDADASAISRQVERPRIGMYHRYLGGNMDEGWTRWLLEHVGFAYTSMLDADVRDANLRRKYDVIILPDDNVSRMTGEAPRGGGGGGFGGGRDEYPPEYRSGFGQEGVDALEAFVKAGGTLVTFGTAGDLPIDRFGLPVRNVVADVPSRAFWSPGSTLRMTVDTAHPLGYGMPASALALFLQGNHAYAVSPGPRNHDVRRIASYVDRDILRSGWLVGEDHIANKAAMVAVRHGQGTVVLIGFRAQHRAQTHGTFKLVFNALVGGVTGSDQAAAAGVRRE
ncbi:MAG TPA: M14 metallopeptidase family protein [Gemmatimonadales bacterium]